MLHYGFMHKRKHTILGSLIREKYTFNLYFNSMHVVASVDTLMADMDFTVHKARVMFHALVTELVNVELIMLMLCMISDTLVLTLLSPVVEVRL